MASAGTYACKYDERLEAERREELILEHMPLVHWVARRIHEKLPPRITLDDLVSTGTLGLIAAIDNYDPRFNVKLATYAQHRIRGAILDSIRGQDGLNHNLRQRAKDVEKAIGLLEQRFHRAPDQLEIARELGVPLEEYQSLLVGLQGISIGTLEATRDDSGALLHRLADHESRRPEKLLERAELEKVLARGISHLSKREQTILNLYYKDELTLAEIAEVMNVHLTRISQLKAQGILRLRAYLERYWPSARGN